MGTGGAVCSWCGCDVAGVVVVLTIFCTLGMSMQRNVSAETEVMRVSTAFVDQMFKCIDLFSFDFTVTVPFDVFN